MRSVLPLARRVRLLAYTRASEAYKSPSCTSSLFPAVNFYLSLVFIFILNFLHARCRSLPHWPAQRAWRPQRRALSARYASNRPSTQTSNRILSQSLCIPFHRRAQIAPANTPAPLAMRVAPIARRAFASGAGPAAIVDGHIEFKLADIGEGV